MKRITVEPPTSDARRDRIERHVFAQLQTIRVADRADAAIPPMHHRRRVFPYAAAAVAAAVAIALFAHVRPENTAAEREVPSQITTPVGGTSQFTVGDAVMVAGSDTTVEVKHSTDGGITLVLGRGSVDCDVAPRNGRPPFHVVAGEVEVEVVGTRFTVTRTPAMRVDVTRGKVRATAPGGTWLVMAGESWSPPSPAEPVPPPVPATPPIAAAPVPAPPAPVVVTPPAPAALVPVPAPVRPAPPRVSPQAAFLSAGRLEASDPERAAIAFREIANGEDAWAAPALYALVELHAEQARDSALEDCAEYLRRFPNDPQAEDVTWLRVQILRGAGRRDEARAAAADYLRKYPHGSYAGLASHLAMPR